MKNMKVGVKITLGFLIVAFIAAIIGAVGIIGMTQINAADTKLYEEQTIPIPDLSDLLVNISSMRSDVRQAILFYDNADTLAAAEESMYNCIDQYKAAREAYYPTIHSAESRALFEEANQLFDDVLEPCLTQTISYAKMGLIGDAKTTLSSKEVAEASKTLITNYNTCMDNRIDNARETSEGNDSLAFMLIITLIGVLALGIAIALVLGLYISRIIARPVRQMSAAAQKLAKGEMDIEITYASKDEVGILADSLKSAIHTLKTYVQDISSNLKTMAQGDMTAEITQEYIGDFAPIKEAMLTISDGLNESLSAINTAAEQVDSGASQVSVGAQTLSQGATEQASSIEELSASIQEISEKVRMNAENVKAATQYVGQAGQGVNESNTQMQQMLAAMAEINTSSNEIGKIIKVIDDIAFQTNILALNAAVEAARAGAAGKGFAVVADEVRNLASKSADAAKQTTALIEGSIRSVSEGTKLADMTAQTLAGVAEKAQMVEKSIEEIDRASVDQAASITQITTGVEQISAVVQENSATAEESAAASEELSGQSAMLTELVARFKLKGAASSKPAKVDTAKPKKKQQVDIILEDMGNLGNLGTEKY